MPVRVQKYERNNAQSARSNRVSSANNERTSNDVRNLALDRKRRKLSNSAKILCKGAAVGQSDVDIILDKSVQLRG